MVRINTVIYLTAVKALNLKIQFQAFRRLFTSDPATFFQEPNMEKTSFCQFWRKYAFLDLRHENIIRSFYVAS